MANQLSKAKRIAFICLPPHAFYYDAVGLTHLHELMQLHGYRSTLSYFNVRFHSFLGSRIGGEAFGNTPTSGGQYELGQLLPFLGLVAENMADENVLRRLVVYLQGLAPHKRLIVDSYEGLLHEILRETIRQVDLELQRLRIMDVGLLAMTSKHMSWLPAIIFAERAKQKNPLLKTVVGGWLSADEAREALILCRHFDFAIWGEGEQPLLELCRAIFEERQQLGRVPHLYYRKQDNSIEEGSDAEYQFFDMRTYVHPKRREFGRLVQTKRVPREMATWVIDGNRGCAWAKCTFCTDYCGYKYRERSAISKVGEIGWLCEKYGAKRFLFADNDIVGRRRSFERLLDELIELRKTHRMEFSISGEVSPAGVDAAIVSKMRRAGIKSVQIGYEATSDRTLAALRKRNRFADNLLFTRLCARNKITVVGANVLMDTPLETEGDIIDGIRNLHYLRFLLGTPYLLQTRRWFSLKKGAAAFQEMTASARDEFSESEYGGLIPEGVFMGVDRRNYLSFTRRQSVSRVALWEKYQAVTDFYRKGMLRYECVIGHSGQTLYRESIGEIVAVELTFQEPVYGAVLQTTGRRVYSLEELHRALRLQGVVVESDALEAVVRRLAKEHLAYVNEDLSQIVAVVEVRPKARSRGASFRRGNDKGLARVA